MKHFISLFFMLIISSFVLEAKEEQHEIDIYVRKSSTWKNPRILYWDNLVKGKYENWPGQAMAKFDKHWFHYKIKGKKAVYLTVNTGSSTKTKDIYRESSAWYYKNRWWDYNPELLTKFTFPQNKTKAIVLSFDDGVIQDKRFIKLLDKYNLKGTFHLNSALLGEAPRVERDEVKKLYKNHEISSHTLHHPSLTDMDSESVTYQVEEDIKDLKKLSGKEVHGLSYPFGSYNDYILHLLEKMKLDYARTVENTHKFDMPNNFLTWHPTVHHNEASEFLEKFIKKRSSYLSLLFIWGHSYEFDYNDTYGWDYIEGVFKRIEQNEEMFWVVGAYELKHYIDSLQNVIFDYDNSKIINPKTNQDVWLKKENSSVLLKSGTSVDM